MAKNKNPNKRITAQQKLFIEYYIEGGDFNATRAAIKAKYSEKTARTTASRLLTLPYIQDYLSKRIKQVLGNTDTLSVQLISKLKDIAFSDLSDIAIWSQDDGLVLKDSKLLNKTNSYPVAEITSRYNSDSERYEFKVKQTDKIKALDMLAKMVKLYEDNKSEEDAEIKTVDLSKKERTEKLLKYQEKLSKLKGK